MEKNKSNLTDSVKYLLAKGKIGSAGNLLPISKALDLSLNKAKQRKKKSIKNFVKMKYLLKKGQKKGNDSLLNKTAICSGAPTALMSCLSTPGQKFVSKKTILESLDYERITALLSNKQNLISTDRSSADRFKIAFIVTSKIKFVKIFTFSQTMDQVTKQVVFELSKRDRKINEYYGLVGLHSLENNDGIDKMLRTPNLLLAKFKEKQILELSVKVVLANKKPNYKSIEFCDFHFIRFLGNGGFSSVFLARCLIDGRLCALKLIKKSSMSQNKYRMLENQKNILFTIDHQRLVDLYYAFESRKYIVFGLQFCPNGNLYQLIQERKSISEEEAKFLFSQILEGLACLHSQKILFRDIKLENILFDENGNAKIADFGLSKPQTNEQDITYSYCGSPQYMAPEMLAKQPFQQHRVGHNLQIDHYALGILLYELLFGRSPFYAAKKEDIFFAIMNSQPQFPKTPSVSKQVKSLIRGLLQKNPKQRIGCLKGVQQIMLHPWLRGFSTQNMESPFKIPIILQNISDQQQQHQLQNQFSQQIKNILHEKLFFTQSFVNKNLVQKLNQSTIKFDEKQKSQKLPKSISKGQTIKLVR